jgi:ATP/ADP translocase
MYGYPTMVMIAQSAPCFNCAAKNSNSLVSTGLPMLFINLTIGTEIVKRMAIIDIAILLSLITLITAVVKIVNINK